MLELYLLHRKILKHLLSDGFYISYNDLSLIQFLLMLQLFIQYEIEHKFFDRGMKLVIGYHYHNKMAIANPYGVHCSPL